jgi:hypothetical protein
MNHLENLGMEILMKKDGALCMIACSFHPFCDPWKKSPVLIVNEPRLTVRMQRIIEMMVRT